MSDDDQGPVQSGEFDPEDLRVIESLPRLPWNRGKPITVEEVEGMRIEFQKYIDTATEAGALSLVAWVYYGGLKTARSMTGDV